MNHPVMALLGQGVPLSLLLDLADPAGPPSREILEQERGVRTIVLDTPEFALSLA